MPACGLLCPAVFPPLPLPPPAGKDDYHAYVVAPKRSLLEVMQDFPSARPSLGAHGSAAYTIGICRCRGRLQC